MRWLWGTIPSAAVAVIAAAWAPAAAEPLTVERAVELALRRNTQVINAEAGVLDARGGVYQAYAGILPRVSATYSRDAFTFDNRTSGTGSVVQGQLVPPGSADFTSYSTSPSVSGSWSVLDLSSLSGLSSARTGLQAARLRRVATRHDVALETRRQFFEVVKAVHLAEVAAEALRLSRDDARRVSALFEVGSVSKSDVLKAQVRTAQSELDSLAARHAVTVRRIQLASLVGVPEAELGEVDTVLRVVPREFDEAEVLAEAVRNRPDLKAADAELRAAGAALRSAHFARLPYITLSGSASFDPRSSSNLRVSGFVFDSTTGRLVPFDTSIPDRQETERQVRGSIALNLDLFDGFAMDSRIATARARKLRAEDAAGALRRNLRGEVRQALIAYREALEGHGVALRAIESATESVKLTQQKYNVGSATILELIDAQVQLQRAKSDGVSAQAAIRVAEAGIDRVRGHGE